VESTDQNQIVVFIAQIRKCFVVEIQNMIGLLDFLSATGIGQHQ
jgi:hypothetical protein